MNGDEGGKFVRDEGRELGKMVQRGGDVKLQRICQERRGQLGRALVEEHVAVYPLVHAAALCACVCVREAERANRLLGFGSTGCHAAL